MSKIKQSLKDLSLFVTRSVVLPTVSALDVLIYITIVKVFYHDFFTAAITAFAWFMISGIFVSSLQKHFPLDKKS